MKRVPIILQAALGVLVIFFSLPLYSVFGPVTVLVTGLGLWLAFDAIMDGSR